MAAVSSVGVNGQVGMGPTSTRQYRSRARALAGFFKKSRDAWKGKYMELKTELKRLKVRVRDVVRSREQWRVPGRRRPKRSWRRCRPRWSDCRRR